MPHLREWKVVRLGLKLQMTSPEVFKVNWAAFPVPDQAFLNNIFPT